MTNYLHFDICYRHFFIGAVGGKKKNICAACVADFLNIQTGLFPYFGANSSNTIKSEQYIIPQGFL